MVGSKLVGGLFNTDLTEDEDSSCSLTVVDPAVVVVDAAAVVVDADVVVLLPNAIAVDDVGDSVLSCCSVADVLLAVVVVELRAELVSAGRDDCVGLLVSIPVNVGVSWDEVSLGVVVLLPNGIGLSEVSGLLVWIEMLLSATAAEWFLDASSCLEVELLKVETSERLELLDVVEAKLFKVETSGSSCVGGC